MHLRTAALASLLATTGTAQTTGVFGTNDYQVNGLGSGSTSCTPLCFPGGGVTLNLSVFAAPGSFGIVVFNFCPCTACSMPAPANACLPAFCGLELTATESVGGGYGPVCAEKWGLPWADSHKARGSRRRAA